MATGDSIYVSGLPGDVSEQELIQFFSQIGSVKLHPHNGLPAVWLFKDADTGLPRGDAAVTFNDHFSASTAIQCCHQKPMRGSIMHVSLTSSADYSTHTASEGQVMGQVPHQEGAMYYDPTSQTYVPSTVPPKTATYSTETNPPTTKEGDSGWTETSDTTQAQPPTGAGTKGRGKKVTAAPQGPARLFGPDDWPCPSCGNTNWARRQRCNLCGAPKPGTLDMRREGQGGGFKELDEEEIEDARRRRKAIEDADDGELYDDYGRIKKKYRNIVDKETREQAALARLRGHCDPSPSGQELAKWFKKEEEVEEKEEVTEPAETEKEAVTTLPSPEKEERTKDDVGHNRNRSETDGRHSRREIRRRSVSPRASYSRRHYSDRESYRPRRPRHDRTNQRDERPSRYRR